MPNITGYTSSTYIILRHSSLRSMHFTMVATIDLCIYVVWLVYVTTLYYFQYHHVTYLCLSGDMSVYHMSYTPPFFFSPLSSSVQEDVLLFRSVLLQKSSPPGTILEGGQSLYSVKLNGPPPNDITVGLNNVDDFTRYIVYACS